MSISWRGLGFVLALAVAQLVAVTSTAAADSGTVAKPAPIGKSSHDAAAPLLDQLKSAKDTAEAMALEARIWAAWMTSGDDKIDAAVQQSTALLRLQLFDESLAILDTVVAKAPDYAEGWNRRATLLYMMQEYDRSLADIQRVLTL